MPGNAWLSDSVTRGREHAAVEILRAKRGRGACPYPPAAL